MRRLLARALLKTAAQSTRLASRVIPAPAAAPLSERERHIGAWVEADGDRTLRVRYDLDDGTVVWDVGGYEGDWAAEIAARYQSRIEIFEPVPAYAERIRKRFERNPRVTVHQVGLGGRARNETIGLHSDESSVFATHGETATIEIADVADQLADSGVAEIALLKLNVEGAEFEVLERLVESGEINRVRDLQVQFHDFVAHAEDRRRAIRESLEGTHDCVYCFPWVWEGWSRKEI